MKNKIYLLSLVVAVLLMSACSSPKNDGKNMAEKINKCKIGYLEDVQNAESNYVSNFDRAGYKSRAEAKQAYQNLLESSKTKYQQALAEVYEQEAKTAKKYAGDYKKAAEFNAALNASFDPDLDIQIAKASRSNDIPEPVMVKVRTIVPSKPDVSQIQKDLVGRSLQEGVDQGYYSSSWKWTIRENEISDFKIETVLSDTPNEYLLEASMRLTSEMGKAFDTKVRIRYVLPQNDDWTIDFVKSLGMYIVKTNTYRGCIDVEPDNGYFTINNQCDKALEVGFTELYYGEWQKSSKIINPYGSFHEYASELKIDYVEVP